MTPEEKAALDAEEERLILAAYRKAKRQWNAEIKIAVRGGFLDHLSTMEKTDLGSLRRMRPERPQPAVPAPQAGETSGRRQPA